MIVLTIRFGVQMTTAATAAPAAPAPMPPTALTTAGIPPPIAMLWAAANRLPAATLPIPACNPAAIEPIYSMGSDVASIMGQDGTYQRLARQRRSQQRPVEQGLRRESRRHQ